MIIRKIFAILRLIRISKIRMRKRRLRREEYKRSIFDMEAKKIDDSCNAVQKKKEELLEEINRMESAGKHAERFITRKKWMDKSVNKSDKF